MLYSTFQNTSLSNKLTLKVKLKPNKIMRGISGHFLSAKTSHIRTALEDIFSDAINNPIVRLIRILVFMLCHIFIIKCELLEIYLLIMAML